MAFLNRKTVFSILALCLAPFAAWAQTATALGKIAGIGKNKQGYIDNMDWVEHAQNDTIVNYALSADDNILHSLKLQESRGKWHAIQSKYNRKAKKWLTEDKNINELIEMIDSLTDIRDRKKKPIDGVVWNSNGTATINGVKYTAQQLGSYRAAGAYQFMPETAVKYGLKVDHLKGIDERFDEEKANEAARLYLNELLERYGGNLDLAIAAYNTGEINIDAFLKGNRKLSRETINYVPGFFSRMEDHTQYRNK